MKLGWTRVRLSPGPLLNIKLGRSFFVDLDSFYRKAERPGGNGASNYFLCRVAPGLPIFFGAIAKSGKAKDCKSFILGSNPSGASGAVV